MQNTQHTLPFCTFSPQGKDRYHQASEAAGLAHHLFRAISSVGALPVWE